VAFSDAFLDELASRNDIYDVVSRYVRLKKSGGNYFGLCPFHNEKTGSFSVNTDKQIYHCFGCGVGGGVINFIMRVEKLEFPEAVAFLANLAGMEIPDEDTSWRDNRRRLSELNREAARWFHQMLWEPAGAEGLAYFQRRELQRGTIRRYGLGYAPNRWDGLLNAMLEKGFTKQELLTAGLAVSNQRGGLYDRFRGRVMFPIIDVKGEVIAFGGRVLDDSQPKYLNSPDTPLFNKSRNLFSLNQAKKVGQGRLLLAEGYMDVIALNQAGFPEAVASLGTSLTPDQAKLMRRYAETVYICYDADGAGQAAATRAIDILRAADLKIKIIRIPDAKDPDEFIRKNGPEAFRSLLDSSESHMDFMIRRARSGFDLGSDEGRLEYLKKTVQTLAGVTNPIERDIFASRLASETGVGKDAILAEIARAAASARKRAKAEEQRRSMTPVHTAQPQLRSVRYDNVRSARSEEGVIALLLAEPELCTMARNRGLKQSDFTSEFLGKTYGLLQEKSQEGMSAGTAVLQQALTADEMSVVTQIAMRPSPEDRKRALEDYIAVIRDEQARSKADRDDEDLLALSRALRDKKGYGGTNT